jgi:hypothetical protein
MESGGNAKVNVIFEAGLARSGAKKPTNHAEGPERERFIRDKYERRKYYDSNAYNNLPAPSAAPSASTQRSAGPVSDVARQRQESRLLRKAQSAVTDTRPAVTRPEARSRSPPKSTSAAPRSSSPKRGNLSPPRTRGIRRTASNKNGRVSAPVVPAPKIDVEDVEDLLDLSSPNPVPGAQPQHDLFNFLVQDATTVVEDPQPKRTTSNAQEILDLYNRGTPSQGNFGNFDNAFGNMQQQQQQQPMSAMTNAMGQMNFQNLNMTPQQQQQQQQQMMMYQQQQQQQMMMQQQQQQQMMMQQQQSGMMMNNNNMMMNNNNNNNGMQNSGFGGGSMGGGPPVSSFQPQQQQSNKKQQQQPKKEDPFAQFGMNVFRS